MRGYFKFPIAAIPSGCTIPEADMVFYVQTVTGTPATTVFYNCSSSWLESDDADTVLVPLPCTESGTQSITTTGLKLQDVVTEVNDTYYSGGENVSLALNTTAFYAGGINMPGVGDVVHVGLEKNSDPPSLDFYDINSSEAETGNPYLNVTYKDISGTSYTYINPTPSNGDIQFSNEIIVNITAWDELSAISTCLVDIDAVNYTMTKTANDGDTKNVTCVYEHVFANGGDHDFKVHVNDSENNWETVISIISITTTNLISFIL
mgnify:CR=1 FL=1